MQHISLHCGEYQPCNTYLYIAGNTNHVTHISSFWGIPAMQQISLHCGEYQPCNTYIYIVGNTSHATHISSLWRSINTYLLLLRLGNTSHATHISSLFCYFPTMMQHISLNCGEYQPCKTHICIVGDTSHATQISTLWRIPVM
jgi:hypothetical protein